MMARIRASRSEFSKGWERAVAFQSRMTSPVDAPRAEAAVGDATESLGPLVRWA
jgi:hypothetical protein